MFEQQPLDYDILYALAQRLQYNPYEPEASTMRFFAGELPDDLPAPLPVPDGFRVVGGLTGNRTIVLLETDRGPDDALEAFGAALLTTGWVDETHPNFRQQHGFVHGGTHRRFFHGDDGPSIWTQTYTRPEGATEVRATFQSAELTRQQRTMQRGGMYGMLPPLRAPAGMIQKDLGGGGGGDSWIMYASLASDAPPGEVAAHYAAQLERAGWTRSGAGDDRYSAWTTWTFDAEGTAYRGLFTVVAPLGEPAERLLAVRTQIQ